MSIFSLAETIGDIKRFRTIAALTYEEGFGFLLDKARLRWGVPIECRLRCYLKSFGGMWRPPSSDDYPVRLRILLTKLGPSFVKLGQVLSLRPDLLPPELTAELSKLTNQVPSFPYSQVKQIVKNDLGKPVNQLFKHFDERPFAAASLAQVHRAVLPDGTKVAVKVQRPGIREIVEEDIHVMAFFARMIEEYVPEWRTFRPTQLVREFADTIGRELDFTIEAIHGKRFAEMFAGDETVKVAKIFKEFSSKNVLTMELIQGVRLDDPRALAQVKIDRKIFAQNGVNALLRQVFIEGFFHADPHPGNYFAMPGNVFAFIDYGMVGRLMEKERLELASFFISFLNKDSESAIKHLLHIVDARQAINLASFEHDVDDILHEWYGAKLKEVSLAQTFFRIMESGRKNGIYFPASFAYLAKSFFTTESMGDDLDPEFDFAKQMKPYVAKIIKEELNPLKAQTKILDNSLDYLYNFQAFPEMTMRLLEKMNSGEVGVRINSAELKELEQKMMASGYRQLAITILIMVIVAIGISRFLSVGTLSVVLLIIILLWIWRR